MLPINVGDAISGRTRLFGSMTLTETGILLSRLLPLKIWNYVQFDERLGHTFRHCADDL